VLPSYPILSWPTSSFDLGPRAYYLGATKPMTFAVPQLSLWGFPLLFGATSALVLMFLGVNPMFAGLLAVLGTAIIIAAIGYDEA
jgi:hypothetical protein